MASTYDSAQFDTILTQAPLAKYLNSFINNIIVVWFIGLVGGTVVAVVVFFNNQLNWCKMGEKRNQATKYQRPPQCCCCLLGPNIHLVAENKAMGQPSLHLNFAAWAIHGPTCKLLNPFPWQPATKTTPCLKRSQGLWFGCDFKQLPDINMSS